MEQRAHSAQAVAPPPAITDLPDALYDFVLSRPYLVDKKPIDFDRHRYLIDPYKAFTFDPRHGASFELVLMSAAQVGKSVTIMGGLIFAALKFWSDKFGYFLPDREMADIFSSDRFQPMVASNPSLAILAGEADHRINGVRVKKEDRKRVRSLGASTIFFSYMGGKTSTEAIPMRGIFFDEVRRMKMADIERASERVSHSDYPINCKVSTAGYPDCFAGETQIVVRHRVTGRVLPVAIQDLADTWKEFDILSYNRQGGNRPRWRRINGVICRGLRPMVTVTLSGGTTIRCTASHRFANRPYGQHVIKWTPIAEIPRVPKSHGGPARSGVLTLTEFPNISNTQWHDTTIDAPVDLPTCYAVGAWIAEGTRVRRALHFWQNPGKPLRIKVKAWADSQGLPYTENKAGVRVTLRHRPDLEAIFAACGTGASQKRIPDLILGGSPRQLSSLLDGLLDGDGHRRKAFTSSHASGREWDFFTSSNTLASQVMFLCRRLGKCPTLSCRTVRPGALARTNANGKVFTQRRSVFTVSFNPTSQLSRTIMNALAVTEVRSVKPDVDDLAYDLEVDGTPWFVLAESGALVHNSDIHHYFLRSDQRIWHARCRCKDGVVLTDHWPECLGESKGEYFFRCPVCDKRITNPQDGRYRPRAPENSAVGFHIPQLISPVMTPRRIWDKWMNATDRQEFYNSTLGLPYVDPDSILVPLDVALACVDHALRWLLKGTNCFMGVDQRGGENHVVIGYAGDGGKLVLAHLEIIQGESPFDRLYELMVAYDVDCCVIDALPSYNEAVRFAKQFKRRVFLSYYSENVHMLRWSDRDEELKALYRAKPDSKFEFHVMLDRYKAIEFALMQWVLRRVACPTPEGLVQKVKAKGLERHSHICLGNPETGEQGLFWHLRSVARRKLPVLRRDTEAKKTVDTGEFHMVWEEIGVDPHFLHAFLYCLMASQRRQVTAELWVPQTGSAAPTVQELQKQRPELTATQAGDAAQIQAKILALPQSSPIPGTCGGCQNFNAERGLCTPRRFTVQAGMPACELYLEVVPE